MHLNTGKKMVILNLRVSSDQDEYMHGISGVMYPLPPTSTLKATLIATNILRSPVGLTFPTTQRYDFVVRDSEGKEVIRWSKSKMFADVLGEEIVKPLGKLTYKEDLLLGEIGKPLSTGEYTLEGIVTASTIQCKDSKVLSVPLSDTTDFKIVDTTDSRIGFIYKKLHKFGSKSEGPDYFLQTQRGIDYQLIHKDRPPWKPDPYLEKFACVWYPHKHVKVIGKLELTKPPKIHVDEIVPVNK